MKRAPVRIELLPRGKVYERLLLMTYRGVEVGSIYLDEDPDTGGRYYYAEFMPTREEEWDTNLRRLRSWLRGRADAFNATSPSGEGIYIWWGIKVGAKEG